MGIFKKLTGLIKKAAPVIGGTIGFALGGPFGASIGSGLGSLAAGRSAEDALMNAAFAYGIGSLGQAAGFRPAPPGATGIDSILPGRVTSGTIAGETVTGVAPNFGIGARDAVPVVDMLKQSSNPIFSAIGRNPGTALAAGVGALGLGALGEEETETGGFKQRPYPEGQMRAGMGLVDGIAFNLNDDEERAEYFRRVRERQGFKEKDEDEDREVFVDPIRAYRGGFFPMQQQMGPSGLQQFGQQIGEKIQAPAQEIPGFLNEVESMAEERFGVELDGAGGTNQIGSRLPSFNQNIANLFEQMQNRTGQDNMTQDREAKPARIGTMPLREAPLMGFGGSPVASASASPFGGGQSRTLGGLGSMAGLFRMSEGGSVNKAMGGTHRFYNFPTNTLQYIANKPDDYTEAEQQMAASILATRPPMIDPMQAIGAPDGSGGMMNGGEVNGPGTGTSDSVPARLSDGEFVLTAKAVRGAGNGDRDIGAARMYEMMSELERIA